MQYTSIPVQLVLHIFLVFYMYVMDTMFRVSDLIVKGSGFDSWVTLPLTDLYLCNHKFESKLQRIIIIAHIIKCQLNFLKMSMKLRRKVKNKTVIFCPSIEVLK